MLMPLVFIAGSAVVYVSRASLLAPRSHGFYRFFAWEMILALPINPGATGEPIILLHGITGSGGVWADDVCRYGPGWIRRRRTMAKSSGWMV
jgi:pimeloyl-ACP methyl ester carboxylesterase